MIYDLDNFELLVNLRGGRNNGYWGGMQFLDSNNHLIEYRAVEVRNYRFSFMFITLMFLLLYIYPSTPCL